MQNQQSALFRKNRDKSLQHLYILHVTYHLRVRFGNITCTYYILRLANLGSSIISHRPASQNGQPHMHSSPAPCPSACAPLPQSRFARPNDRLCPIRHLQLIENVRYMVAHGLHAERSLSRKISRSRSVSSGNSGAAAAPGASEEKYWISFFAIP